MHEDSPWRELWLKEDWWAVWIGLGLMIAGFVLFASGSSINWIAVAPAKWSTFSELGAGLSANALRYAAQFGVFLVIFTSAIGALGLSPKAFVPAFLFVYILSLEIFVVGAWDQAQRDNLEPLLVGLLVGLLISNLVGLPRWLDAGFRVEFYIKTGIVPLGATLPFTLIVWAGPVAILQASIVSIATFLVIFFVGRKLGLDHQLAATLGAGGAVCGVSAAIAIAGAVRAKKLIPADRDNAGGPMGDSYDLRATVDLSRTAIACGRSRRLDWHVGIRRCSRLRSRTVLRLRICLCSGL